MKYGLHLAGGALVCGRKELKEVAAVTGLSISTLFDQYRAGISALRQQMGVPCQNKND